jgi:ankyrin repeat protein
MYNTRQVPGLAKVIKRYGLIDTNIGPTFVWELEALKRALKDAMSSNRANVCVLVDALDEFEGSIPELINLLKEIEQQSGFTRSTIKICVASRPHANIILELEQSQRLRMEDCNHEDISRFVQQRLGPLLSSHVNELDFPRLSEAIIKKAEGVFLWVSFAVTDLIEGFSYGDTAEDLERRLDEMPPDMENVYRRILRNVNQRYKLELMLMLQIVCRSTVPLTVDQLTCALSVGMFPTQEDDQSKYVCQTASLSEAERTRLIHRIHVISGGLLEIIEFKLKAQDSESRFRTGYVSTEPLLAAAEYGETRPMVAPKDSSEYAIGYNVILLHKTLEAFLDLPDWNRDLKCGKEPEFTLDGHQLLLRSCGIYMQQFDKALEDTEAEVEFTDERWPFLEYAFRYLPYHARFSESRTGTSSRILLNAISHPKEYPLPTLSRYSTTQFKYDDSFQDITPLELAFGHGLTLYGRDLLREGADPNAGGGKPLRNAALSSNVKMVKELLSAGAVISPSHLRANQALVHAAAKGNFEILVLLLDHGADPNTLGPPNPLQPGINTALYEAIRLQSKRAVKHLLEKGADVDMGCFRRGELYLTPLQQAVSSGNMSMVDLLIENGAGVNKVSGHLGGAIQTARYHNDEAMVRRLLDAGAEKG